MYQPFDVLRVPFPYSDLSQHKARPAIVLSPLSFNETSPVIVIAMVTTAKHSKFPLDVYLDRWMEAGLPCPCLMRMKFFTIEKHLVERRAGQLHTDDRQNVILALRTLFPYLNN